MNTKCQFAWTCLFVVAGALPQANAQSALSKWLPMSNSSMEPIAGSALDLGGITKRRNVDLKGDVSATIQGEHFSESTLETGKLRFFTATLGIGPNNGGFPDRSTSDRLAKMIKHNGYNAVRVHFVEAMLMSNRKQDFDFDPEQLDRFFYLMNALRQQGMYFFVDMLGSWNGAYGDVRSHRWTRGQYDVTLGSLVPGKDREHWLKLVKALWARKNPYSGLSTLEDPAVAGIVLVNEGGTDFLLRRGPREELLAPFQQWLLKKYGNEAAMQLKIGKSLNQLVLPSVSDRSLLGSEFQRFASDIQQDQVAWMQRELQTLGYRGAVTSFNDWPGYHASVPRTGLSFVDMHQYADHPVNGMVEPGTKLGMGSLLDGRNRFLDKLAWSRIVNQPFTVSEYGQPFWNPNRWEVAPFTAAYGSLQGWSQITHFGNTLSLTRPALGKWRAMMVPFEVGTDPTLRAGETIAAFLFGRGDVSAATSRLIVKLNAKEAAGLPADQFVPWPLAQMQYVLGVGLRLEGAASKPRNDQRTLLEISTTEDSIKTTDVLKRLKTSGAVDIANSSDPNAGRYTSTTGELQIDLKANSMTVSTKGSVGLLGKSGTHVSSSGVSINLVEGAAAVFLSDLGAADISKSKNALMIVSTDSRNTGMTFKDADETILDQIGTFPALLRDATVSIDMAAADNKKDWQLYALSLTGERTMKLPVQKLANGTARARIELRALGANVTPYFEWVAQ